MTEEEKKHLVSIINFIDGIVYDELDPDKYAALYEARDYFSDCKEEGKE